MGSRLILAKAKTLSPSLPNYSFAELTSSLEASSKSLSSPLIRILLHLLKILSGAPFIINISPSSLLVGCLSEEFISLTNMLNLISEEKGIKVSICLPPCS